MKLSSLLLLSVIVTLVFSYKQDGKVLVLTPQDIDSAISEFDNILIKFYAPWCGHCQNLAPIYLETALALSESGSTYKLGEFDCDEYEDICKKYKIRGYPTLLLFSKGREPIKFSAKRQKESIITWLNQNTLKQQQKKEQFKQDEKVENNLQQKQGQNPQSSQLNIKKQQDVLILQDSSFQTALETYDYLFVKFFAPWCGHCKSLAPIYTQIATSMAQQNQNIKIAQIDCTLHSETCKIYKISGYPTLTLFLKGKQPIQYEGSREKEVIIKWLNEQTQTKQQKIVSNDL